MDRRQFAGGRTQFSFMEVKLSTDQEAVAKGRLD
jgi:hypothetical protein